MDYSEAIKYLESLPDMERGRRTPGNPTMSLESMKHLLKIMGNPQNDTKTIHITGSKGKGSTSTMIASILEAAGYKTALYTSPHLHSYRERIAFGLKPIDESRFADGVEKLAGIIRENAGEGIEAFSTFGILTALFFLLVRESSPKVDWQVVEVGLGGTTDATNVFETKEMAVITPISVEHAAILGSTRVAIARHKGGIITPGCSVILADQKDAGVTAVIEEICADKNAKLIETSSAFKIKQLDHDLRSQSFELESDDQKRVYRLPFLAPHQLTNAATALIATAELNERGWSIPESAKVNGLANANLPGRFEIISNTRIERDSAPITFIVDGAHNEDSARALAVGIEQYFSPHRCILILALNTDKDVSAFWRSIKSVCKAVIATRSDNPRSIAPEDLKNKLKEESNGIEVVAAESASLALEKAIELSSSDDVICAAGSLYLVAQIRALLLADERSAVPFLYQQSDTRVSS